MKSFSNDFLFFVGVGYRLDQPVNGGKIYTPTFTPMKGGKMNLQDIKPQGGCAYYETQIQLLDSNGFTLDDIAYTWVDYAGPNADSDGWVDDSTLSDADIEISIGDGLWLIASDSFSDISIASSGLPICNEISVPLLEGGRAIGNPYYKTITLGELIASGSDAYYNVQIQKIDENGFTVDDIAYTWVDYAGPNSDADGWVNDSTLEDASEIEILPGEGIWVSGSIDPNGDDLSDCQLLTFYPDGLIK